MKYYNIKIVIPVILMIPFMNLMCQKDSVPPQNNSKKIIKGISNEKRIEEKKFIKLKKTLKGKRMYYFYGKNCPHCPRAESIVKKLSKKYGLTLKIYEIWYNDRNRSLFRRMARDLKKTARSVPSVIFGNNLYEGIKNIEKLEDKLYFNQQ